MSIKTMLSEHLVSTVVLAAMFAAVGTIGGSYLSSKAGKETALMELQPKIVASIVEPLQKENNRLHSRLAKLEEKTKNQATEADELRKRISELELIVKQQFDQVKTLGSFPEYMPGPAWMKTSDSVMLLLNEAYSREWGVSKWQYVGKKDADVWPEDVASEFVANDKKVLDCRCPVRTYEHVPRKAMEPVSDRNRKEWWVIWKWPVVKDGEIFGLAGAAFEPSEEELKRLNSK